MNPTDPTTPPDPYPNLIRLKKGYDPRRRAGGRPKVDPVFRTKAQKWTPEMLDRLHQLALGADTDASSIQAIKLLLVYAWGPLEKLDVAEPPDAMNNPIDELSLAELRALARRSLVDDATRDEADDDDESDSTESN